MSSKTVKTVAIVGAVVAVGWATGGFGLAGLGGAGAGAGGGALSIGAGLGGAIAPGGAFGAAAVLGGSGGFFAGVTGFQAASLGLGALSFGSSMMGMQAAKEDAEIQKAQIEANNERRRIQALQDKAAALNNFERARGTAMAKSAASNQEPGRDMMAQIKVGEGYLADELGNIALNAGAGNRTAALQIQGADNASTAATYKGLIGGGRSLLTGYRDYNDTRMA